MDDAKKFKLTPNTMLASTELLEPALPKFKRHVKEFMYARTPWYKFKNLLAPLLLDRALALKECEAATMLVPSGRCIPVRESLTLKSANRHLRDIYENRSKPLNTVAKEIKKLQPTITRLERVLYNKNTKLGIKRRDRKFNKAYDERERLAPKMKAAEDTEHLEMEKMKVINSKLWLISRSI